MVIKGNDAYSCLEKISRRKFLKIASLTSAGLLTGCDPFLGGEGTLALVNGILIDGTGTEALLDGSVVIRDRRIIASGTPEQVQIPIDAHIIDVQRGTILPGFINTHVHSAYSSEALKIWARGGVTTVRDLGASKPYSKELFKTRNTLNDTPKCSRLVAVGSFVNVEGGYPIAGWSGNAVTVSSPKEARQAVNRLIDDGADVIKTAMESGYAFGMSGWPLLSPKAATALVEAAHGRGKLVTAHVTDARDLGRALDAGVDEIAHMVVGNQVLSEKLISRMVNAGIRWIPTLELWQGVNRKYPFLNYESSAIYNLSRFVKAGGEVALGTDFAGAPNINFNLGMPINEIKCMSKAGMTPMQIIVAATRNSARSCGRQRDLGTLEPGKLADVLVVNGNPLDDINTLTSKRIVLREGKVVI
jgi:imidazolonepropionase-like amidohydrolase